MSQIRKLSQELEKVATAELNETPSRLESDLAAFKQWIAQTPHLNPRMDDQFLVAFLRGCKFNMEKAKAKLDKFYTLRQQTPELFSNRTLSEEMIDFIASGSYLKLPHKNGPAGAQIFLLRPGARPLTHPYDANKWISMIHDICMYEDDNIIVSGAEHIFDMKGASLAYSSVMTPSFLKKINAIWQEGYPFRTKAIHIINNRPLFSAIINFSLMFASKKIRKRFTSSDTVEPLFKKVPQNLLPKEYGGDAGSIEEIAQAMVKQLKENEQFFKDDIKFGVNENARVGNSKKAAHIFGVKGSFRKLEVD